MRDCLRQVAGDPAHVGLAYEVWAPVAPGTGKVPDAQRDAWLERLAKTPIAEGYRHAYNLWVESLRNSQSYAVEMELASRLLVGHGNSAATEVGLTLHHTWSVPIIPGSALKGVLAHYLEATYGPDESDRHPMDASLAGEDARCAAFQGVTWDGARIEHGPGETYRALFGAPAARSDPEYRHAGPTQGCVAFHDALFVPGSDNELPLAPDVLTVHHKMYYDSHGAAGGPNDYERPVPVAFLSVRPGARFLLAMSGPPDWIDFSMKQLQAALVAWGVGGKTASGYGRAKPGAWRPVVDPGRAAVERCLLLGQFRAWLDDETLPGRGQAPTQKQRLASIQAEWLPKLRELGALERKEAVRLMKKKIHSRKFAQEVERMASLLAD